MTDSKRRRFLRGIGASIALPLLESLVPPAAKASRAAEHSLQRLVCIGTYLGFHQPDFYPAQAGRAYKMSTVLQPVERHRNDFSIFSGLDHRGRNGHHGWRAWMTGSVSGSVSMDQLVAGRIGVHSRFDSLQLTCGSPPSEARLSFTSEGIALPMIGRPSTLYRTLFSSGEDRSRTRYLLASNRSVLDGVTEEAVALERTVSASDRLKLGEYFASIRSVEKALQKQRLWLDRPVPKVEYPLPEFDPVAPDPTPACRNHRHPLQ